MKSLCTLIVCVAALVAAAPASADVLVEGTGEPAYTNSANNTQWIRWQPPGSIDAYRLRATYYRDNVQVGNPIEWSVPIAGGATWLNWSGVATLEDGKTYGICVQGEYSFPNDSMFFQDGPNSCSMGAVQGKRSSTTIDRSKPTISVTAAGGADTVTTGSIPLAIAFTDATAGPFPANFICVQQGTAPCTSVFTASAGCSLPGSSGRNTTFNCTVDASALADGPVTVCARAADAAVPDNPNSANQAGQATSANLSDPQCDTVTLNRTTTTPPGDGGGTGSGDAGGSGDGGGTGTGGTGDGAGTGGGPTGSGPLTGSGLKVVRIGTITVQVPKSARLRKTKHLTLGARTAKGGTLTLRLTRSGKVYSRVVRKLAAGDSKHRLLLPRTLKAGTYTVKITFKPAGRRWSLAGTAKTSLRR